MTPTRQVVFLEVVDHEEYVEVEARYGPTGELVGATPLGETRTAFLHLQAPDGTRIRAEIDHGQLDAVLGMMFPELAIG